MRRIYPLLISPAKTTTVVFPILLESVSSAQTRSVERGLAGQERQFHMDHGMRPLVVTDREKHEDAKNALLQFNVMIDQGIKPNVLMYTSLIAKMAEAKFEWQAYKFFSRMLDEGITPLPQTYVALRRATNPRRQRLVNDISERMAEHAREFPKLLIEKEKERLKQEEEVILRQERALQEHQAKMAELGGSAGTTEEGKKGKHEGLKVSDLIRELSGLDEHPQRQQHQSQRSSPTSTESPSRAFSVGLQDDEVNDNYATMHIDSPNDVFNVHSHHVKQTGRAKKFALNPSEKEKYSAMLQKMHLEELQILLTIKKELKPVMGSQDDEVILKQKTIGAVLRYYAVSELEGVFQRRNRYFRAVQQMLEIQMGKMEGAATQGDTPLGVVAAGGDERTEVNESPDLLFSMMSEEAEVGVVPVTSQETPLSLGEGKPVVSVSDSPAQFRTEPDDLVLAQEVSAEDGATADDVMELNPLEKYRSDPEVLYTPWGMMRKPERHPALPSSQPNPRRTAAATLNDEELQLLFEKASAGELDLAPPTLLRRYARTHILKFKRNKLDDLYEAVRWHILTFPPESANPQVAATALKELEQEGMSQTLDTFEALTLFAKRCNNMQVVDTVEVARATKKARMVQRKAHAKMYAEDRQMKNLTRAESLRNSAREFNARENVMQNNPHMTAAQLDEEMRKMGGGSGNEEMMMEDSYGPGSSIVGLGSVASNLKGLASSTSDPSIHELPPWSVELGKEDFHVDSGTFGDTSRGWFSETRPGKIGVVPNETAKYQYSVDLENIKEKKREPLRKDILDMDLNERVYESKEERLSSYPKLKSRREHPKNYFKKKREKEKEKKARNVVPVAPPRHRFSQLLTEKRHRPQMHSPIEAAPGQAM